jgi:hypothetical protein
VAQQDGQAESRLKQQWGRHECDGLVDEIGNSDKPFTNAGRRDEAKRRRVRRGQEKSSSAVMGNTIGRHSRKKNEAHQVFHDLLMFFDGNHSSPLVANMGSSGRVYTITPMDILCVWDGRGGI